MAVGICVPNQSLTESLCLTTALNHWCLIDGIIVLRSRCQALCRGPASGPELHVAACKVPQVKLIYGETTPLPQCCTWPHTTKDALVIKRGLIKHHGHNFLQQPPRNISLEHLLWDLRGHHDRGHLVGFRCE